MHVKLMNLVPAHQLAKTTYTRENLTVCCLLPLRAQTWDLPLSFRLVNYMAIIYKPRKGK